MNNSFWARFDSLSSREKIIVLLTLLVGIWAAWDHLFYQMIAKQQENVILALEEAQYQLIEYQQDALKIETLGKIDPNHDNKAMLVSINAKLNALKQQLNEGGKQFVPAKQMAQVLDDMLKKNDELKLLNLETLAVTTLLEFKTQQPSWVYRHGLSITVEGRYFDILHYLEGLESLPWRFDWESIEYQVKEYPLAEATIKIYTLSFEESWLGL